MTKKNLIASVIATALAMQMGVPYALAAEPISVTKNGNVLTVSGTQDITVYDSNANVINNQVTINNDGTVNVSALPKGSEKYYIKAGEDFYSFMSTNPSLVDDFSEDKGWVFVRPHNMTAGSSTITSSINLDPVNNGKVMKNVSEGGDGLFIPTQDYRQYDSKNSTIEVIEEVVSGTAGQEYPKTSSAAQIFVNMQEIYRPASTDYQYANWKLSTKGYGVLVTWNNVIIRRYDGEYTNQYKAIDRTAPSADYQAGVAIYASKAADSAVTSPIQADYTKYWRKIDTKYEDGKVIIDISIAPVDTDGTILNDKMWKGSYTDTNPVSTCGSFGVSRWFFTNPAWQIYSFKFTNNTPNEVVKEDGIANINANVTNVIKSGDSIDVRFDGEVTAFSTDKIRVLSASGAQQNVTKTFGDKKATIDLSTLNKNGTTYSLVISTVNGDNTHTFNMPAVWTADFTQEACGLHRYREDQWGNTFDTNGAIDAGGTSYTVSEFTSGDKTYNEALIHCGALHFSDDMRNLTPATSGNIEFNTHMGKYGISPAVAYISDARQRADATEPYTGGDFQAQISGYLIYYYGGSGLHCLRLDSEQPTTDKHDNENNELTRKIVKEDEGFTRPSGNDANQPDKIWGVKSSIKNVGNSVVITYQLTDQNGKTGTYTFTDNNPVSDKYLIGIASGMARAGGSNISDLKIYYGDDTVTYVKNAKDEMTEWVNARKQQTGRTEINMVTLGGSITQGAGWSGMLAEYFSKQTGTTFNLINSGIGGTGSDLAAARLEKDVIEKQPDIVFLDHAVNDGSQKLLNHSQYMKTATNVEYIIRKLMAMENPPLIYMVDFTTEELLKNDLRMDANYEAAEKAFADGTLTYDFDTSIGGKNRKKGELVTDANDLYWFRKAYVGAADNATNFGNPAFYVRALPEDVYDYIAEYYNIPSINLHNFLKQYCSLDKSVTEAREKNANDDYTMNVDYYALQNDYKSYASNNNDAAIVDKYDNGLGDTDTDIQAILGDKVHSNDLGKRLYGDYMIHLFETNPAYRFKPQTYNEKTLIGEDYAAVSGMKDVKITAYIIENNAKFSVTGDLTIDDSHSDVFISDSVKITNSGSAEGSLTYTFKGRQFGAVTEGTAKSITLDGAAYSSRTMRAMYEKLNGLNHKFTITLAPGQSVELRRMFTDEDSIPNVGTAIASDDSSVVTLDITDYANAVVYRNTDGKDGDVYAYYGNTPWQKAHTHVSTTQESVDWGLLSAQNIIKDLDNDNLWRPTGSKSVYDMSVLKRNSYYKAIRANLNKSLYVPEINTQSVSLLTVPCFPGSNSEGVNAIKAKLVYSNGETQEVTFTPDDAITTLNRVNGNGVSSGDANLYEITVNADSTKKLSEIKFDGNSCKMLILGVSLKPLTEGSDKIAAYYEALSDTYGNVIGADASGKYDLATYKGRTVRYTADVLNLAAVSGNYTIRLALYNGGKLVNVVSSDCTVDEKGRINADITIPDDNNQYSLKAFVWNAGNEMIPMKSAKVFEK